MVAGGSHEIPVVELQFVEAAVKFGFLQQLRMSPSVHNPAVIHHHDAIRF
jgi:hypothetical protein